MIRGIKIMNPNFEPFNDFDSPVTKNKESEVQDIIDFDETGSQMTGNSKETLVVTRFQIFEETLF